MLGQSLPPVHSVKRREDVDEEKDPGKDADDDGEYTDDDSRHPADSVRAPTPPLEAVCLNKPINADVFYEKRKKENICSSFSVLK